MTIFQYPSCFSALDREHIDQAVRTAEAKLTGEISGIASTSGYAQSEAEAVQFVRDVAVAVVDRLQRRQDQLPPDALRRCAADLVDQIILYASQLTKTTLEAFETRVRHDLSMQAWWVFVTDPAPTPSLSPPASDDHRVPFSIQEAAERLGVSDSTIRRLQKRGKLTFIQIGTKLKRIPQADIDRLLATGQYPRLR